MASFAVIEVDNGLTIVEVQAGQSAEDAAVLNGGLLIDPGPYESYDEACDVLSQLTLDEEER